MTAAAWASDPDARTERIDRLRQRANGRRPRPRGWESPRNRRLTDALVALPSAPIAAATLAAPAPVLAAAAEAAPAPVLAAASAPAEPPALTADAEVITADPERCVDSASMLAGFAELESLAAQVARRRELLGPHDPEAADPGLGLPSAYLFDPAYERYVRRRGPGVLEEWALREAMGLPPIGVDERPFRVVAAELWGRP